MTCACTTLRSRRWLERVAVGHQSAWRPTPTRNMPVDPPCRGSLRNIRDSGTQYPWHNRPTGLDGLPTAGCQAVRARFPARCPSPVVASGCQRISPIRLRRVRSRGGWRCGVLPRPPHRHRSPWSRAAHGSASAGTRLSGIPFSIQATPKPCCSPLGLAWGPAMPARTMISMTRV